MEPASVVSQVDSLPLSHLGSPRVGVPRVGDVLRCCPWLWLPGDLLKMEAGLGSAGKACVKLPGTGSRWGSVGTECGGSFHPAGKGRPPWAPGHACPAGDHLELRLSSRRGGCSACPSVA